MSRKILLVRNERFTWFSALTFMLLWQGGIAYGETQSFDDAPSTAAAGWLGSGNTVGGNGYGFATSNIAGGLAGEGGGTIAVRTSDFTYYADLTLGGALDQQTPLAASGKFTITDFNFDGGFELGFFNSASTTKANNVGVGGIDQAIMLRVLDGGRLQVRSGNEGSPSSPNNTFAPNVDYTFQLTYDPNGVAPGTALMSAEFRRQSDNVLVDTRTAAVPSTGSPFSLNAFGIATLDFDRNDPTTGFFVDDLTYSTYVPPPPPPVIQLGLALQTFDNEASAAAGGWTGHRNRDPDFHSDYGFSPTNSAGGSMSEMGGAVPARTSAISSYADTALGGSLTQGQPLSASGLFTITEINGFDGGFEFGFFDAEVEDGTPAFIGMRIVDGTATSLRWGVHRDVNGPGETLDGSNQLVLGEVYRFAMTYDPAGGGIGVGRLSLEFVRVSDNGSLGVRTLDFSSLGADADLNAFGLKTLDFNANVGGTARVLFDNLEYSTIVPEPAALAAGGEWTTVAARVAATRTKARRYLRVIRLPSFATRKCLDATRWWSKSRPFLERSLTASERGAAGIAVFIGRERCHQRISGGQ